MPSVPDNGHADMFESVLSLWDSITLGDCPGALLQNSAAGVTGRVSRSALRSFGQFCALTTCSHLYVLSVIVAIAVACLLAACAAIAAAGAALHARLLAGWVCCVARWVLF